MSIMGDYQMSADELKGNTYDCCTVGQLRALLFAIDDQTALVHVITKMKYGEIVETKSVIDIREVTDESGATHVVLTTS